MDKNKLNLVKYESNDDILLFNRYHDDVRLIKVDDETYEYHIVVSDEPYAYIRCSFDTKQDGTKIYYSVDPPGGPFLSIGDNFVSVLGKKELYINIREIIFDDKRWLLKISEISEIIKI